MMVITMVNLKASVSYQLADNKKSISVYYLVIVLVCLLSGIGMYFASVVMGAGDSVVMSGISAATVIFAFVASLCSFKENFGMLLQNGVSRRSLFAGRLCTTAILSLVMAVADEVLTLAVVGLGRATGKWDSASLFETVFVRGIPGTELVSLGPVLTALVSVAFSFFLILAVSGVGYFLTVLFYRLNKLGKILVGAGVPALWFFVLPSLALLDYSVTGGRVSDAILSVVAPVAQFVLGRPQNAMAFLLVVFALFSTFSWLLLRRATIRK